MEHFGDEANADITAIFCVVDVIKRVIRVLSDDRDVFVLLVYLGYREVQMEEWWISTPPRLT